MEQSASKSNQFIYRGILWSTFRRHHDNLMSHISYHVLWWWIMKNYREVCRSPVSSQMCETEALVTFYSFPSVGCVETSGRYTAAIVVWPKERTADLKTAVMVREVSGLWFEFDHKTVIITMTQRSSTKTVLQARHKLTHTN